MTFTTKSLTAIALAGGLAATGVQAQEATFGMVDVDGDGYLSETELTDAFGEVGLTLLRYDLDGDGQLTPQEIEARNEARVGSEDTDEVPSDVDDILERGRVGNDRDDDDDEDVIEDDEFGETEQPMGDVDEDEGDGSDDEFGNLEENEIDDDEADETDGN
ncbi:MAG: hypothetical protein ACU0E9_16960 [Limimaricola soesokkakensis]|uniref:hypothetical protein n=1 Tax=Limimaricola soesokkakensis TaxID=1343159 RepID=UPI0040585394